MSWMVILNNEECGYRRKPLLRSARCSHPKNPGTTKLMETGIIPDLPPCERELCPVIANKSDGVDVGTNSERGVEGHENR